MIFNKRMSRQLVTHGIIGAATGLLLVAGLLASDTLGLRSMVLSNDLAPLHMLFMMIKPMGLFALLALGYSLWRQVAMHPELAPLTVNRRIRPPMAR